MKVKDPVCGMEVEPENAFARRENQRGVFFFCSQNCVNKFDAEPHRYDHPKGHEHHEEDGAQSRTSRQ